MLHRLLAFEAVVVVFGMRLRSVLVETVVNRHDAVEVPGIVGRVCEVLRLAALRSRRDPVRVRDPGPDAPDQRRFLPTTRAVRSPADLGARLAGLPLVVEAALPALLTRDRAARRDLAVLQFCLTDDLHRPQRLVSEMDD